MFIQLSVYVLGLSFKEIRNSRICESALVLSLISSHNFHCNVSAQGILIKYFHLWQVKSQLLNMFKRG
jgi:hypothetical protein